MNDFQICDDCPSSQACMMDGKCCKPLPPVPCSAICGHCGNRRDKHFFEFGEIYCFENTTGDVWTNEPGWENIGLMIETEYPVLWKEMVAKWKEDNGHSQTQNK